MQLNFSHHFSLQPLNYDNPDPWLALYLDQSVTVEDEAKAALLLSMRSKSRQFFFPVVSPFTKAAIAIIQLIKIFIPNSFTSSWMLHRLIYWGLKYFVSPEANFLIMRHFHLGSEILAFIADNAPTISMQLRPLKPATLEDLLDDVFLKHDLNLFNFVIELNRQMRAQGCEIEPQDPVNFAAITDGPFYLAEFPRRFTNVIDVQTAIELYTPLYQLFLTDNDFWRAANSLQLDETIGVYVARILNSTQYLGLINNKHPMVPLTTLSAGFRLMLHGLAAETLHATLREVKRQQAAARP